MNEIITAARLWEDFDERFGGKSEEISVKGKFHRYRITVFSEKDGDVVIDTEVYYPQRDNGRAVLIVGDCGKKAQAELIKRLTKSGLTVVLPDYSGVFSNTQTSFPPSLDYGFFSRSGDHLTKLCPTVRETGYFLYSRIIRKIISLMKQKSPDADVVLMGLKRGTEVALQVAGTDKRLIGLALVSGAGYREYVDYPKYGSSKLLSVEGELMQWLTAVSGTAYAKRVTVPTLIALGSNGTSDVDRMSNLMELIEGPTTLVVSAGYRDNIEEKAFGTVMKWLEKIFLFGVPPETPSLIVKINEEGKVYADIRADDCIKIKEVRIKYSYGDNNHATRAWKGMTGQYVGAGEYIARIDVQGEAMIFAYPVVEYENGLIICGGVDYCDVSVIGGAKKKKRAFVNPIVFQYPDPRAFVEISDDTIIFESSLNDGVLPIGVKGICCDKGGMVTYNIGEMTGFDETRLLQIDSYSHVGTYYLTVSVVDQDNREYTATRRVECSDAYASLLLKVNYFKDKNLQPLEKWEGLKSLAIHNSGVTIGKIMFV